LKQHDQWLIAQSAKMTHIFEQDARLVCQYIVETKRVQGAYNYEIEEYQ
jgi:hypothetical protein